jgi:phage N-6-adenine-methyltransferase
VQLQINSIRTDGGTQPRIQLDSATINDYAESMADGVAFPPVVTFYDGSNYWLADGYHRLHAAQSLGLADIPADIRQGTLQDAQWYSYSVNQTHGLRRSNEDKRRTVESALRHEYASRCSTRELAKHCGVSHMTIQRYQESICNNVTDAKVVTRNGNTYEMNTANIGRHDQDNIFDERDRSDWIELQSETQEINHLPSEYRSSVIDSIASSDYTKQDDEYDGDEWYTPVEFIDAARELMGSIDLDPASCEAAQQIVGAGDYYTKGDDAISQDWCKDHGDPARIWCNPPYSTKLIQDFTAKLLHEYDKGHIESAVYLVNNCTDAGWFHSLMERFPMCFTRGRVKFWRPDKTTFATRQGQVFFYLGNDVEGFAQIFSRFGVVVARTECEVTA